jgi:hypothetical protein
MVTGGRFCGHNYRFSHTYLVSTQTSTLGGFFGGFLG